MCRTSGRLISTIFSFKQDYRTAQIQLFLDSAGQQDGSFQPFSVLSRTAGRLKFNNFQFQRDSRTAQIQLFSVLAGQHIGFFFSRFLFIFLVDCTAVFSKVLGRVLVGFSKFKKVLGLGLLGLSYFRKSTRLGVSRFLQYFHKVLGFRVLKLPFRNICQNDSRFQLFFEKVVGFRQSVLAFF